MPRPRVRPAVPADLPLLRAIEDSGDALFTAWLGRPLGGDPTPTGEQRAAAAYLLLVLGDPVVGFAHVDLVAGRPHLEQISVRAEHTGHGLGGVLLQEVCRVLASRGHADVTLLTFADVPWNAPFYARHGFVVVEPVPERLAGHRATEVRLGLDDIGRRVAMIRPLVPLDAVR